MSIPPHLDTTNPANTNSQYWRRNRDNEIKRWPPTLGDIVLTGIILGIFALAIVATILKQ